MRLEEHVIANAAGDLQRTVWFAAGPASAEHPLCVFLDGEHYLEDKLDALSACRAVEPMSVAFVSYGSAGARHEDYVCNDRFAAFIAEDLLPWAQGRVATLQNTEHVICGVSLSGLAAAHVSLRYPKLFTATLAQSGSFWWDEMRFVELVRAASTIHGRYWLSVGDQETDVNVRHPPTAMHQTVAQIDGVEAAVAALQAAGSEVHLARFSGGHVFPPWRKELPIALRWLRTRPQAREEVD